MRRSFGDGAVVVGVAEQFLHSSHVWYTVLPRRFTTNGWNTRLKKNRVGVRLRAVSNTIATAARSRSHPQCAA